MRTSALLAALGAGPAVSVAQLHFPLTRQPQHAPAPSTPQKPGLGSSWREQQHHRHRRDNNSDTNGAIPVKLLARPLNFAVNATVGTPPQPLSLFVTVQADQSWVPDASACYSPNATSPNEPGYYGSLTCDYGALDANKSTTLQRVNTFSFSASYIDGSYAMGGTVRDTLCLVGPDPGPSTAGISSLSMGLVQDTDLSAGVLALGQSFLSDGSSFPERARQLGQINSSAYSLWPTTPSYATAELLLGAVDTSRLAGPLLRFPMENNPDGNPWIGANLTALNGSTSAGADATPLLKGQRTPLPWVAVSPTELLTNLPYNIAQAIWTFAGATYNETWSLSLIPCSAANTSTAHLKLQLAGADGPVLDVPVSDLVLPREVWVESTWSWDDGGSASDWCLFGVQSTDYMETSYSSTPAWILGSSVLGRSYVVVDLENQDMAIAPVQFSATGTSSQGVVAFPSQGAAIPSSTAVSGAVADPGGCASAIAAECSGSNTGPGRSGNSSGSLPGVELSGGAVAGIAVGAALGLIALLGLLVFLAAKRAQTLGGEKGEKGEKSETGGKTPVTEKMPQQPVNR